jgi:hypothetical protein
MIVVRLGEAQVEVFSPPMKRTPDPKPTGASGIARALLIHHTASCRRAPLKSKLELRYRVRAYGQ